MSRDGSKQPKGNKQPEGKLSESPIRDFLKTSLAFSAAKTTEASCSKQQTVDGQTLERKIQEAFKSPDDVCIQGLIGRNINTRDATLLTYLLDDESKANPDPSGNCECEILSVIIWRRELIPYERLDNGDASLWPD